MAVGSGKKGRDGGVASVSLSKAAGLIEEPTHPTERSIVVKMFTRLSICLGSLRFMMLSHRFSHTDNEILIFFLTSLILLDVTGMTFFFSNIYYARTEGYMQFNYILIFAPFPFATILSPFLALFLVR